MAANGYIITHSTLSSNRVEEICQTLTGKGARKGSKVPSGKSLLSCLRAMCMSQVIFHNSVDVDLLTVLLGILKNQTDSDIDRKIFRVGVFLMMEVFLYPRQGIKEDQLSTFQIITKEFMDLVRREASKGSGLRKAFSIRSLGILSYSCAMQQQPSSILHVKRVLQNVIIPNDELVGMLWSSMSNLKIHSNDTKEHLLERTIQLNSIFSSLRRMPKSISKEIILYSLDILARVGNDPNISGLKFLVRNISAVLQIYVATTLTMTFDETELLILKLTDILKSQSNTLLAKDDLAASTFLQTCAHLCSISFIPEKHIYLSVAIDLLQEIVKLIPNSRYVDM